jgi:hypothetical protein
VLRDAPGIVSAEPIQDLIDDEGCDLEADILPVVRELLTVPGGAAAIVAGHELAHVEGGSAWIGGAAVRCAAGRDRMTTPWDALVPCARYAAP